MFTFKNTPIEIQLESKFDYDEELPQSINHIEKLSDIWSPSYFCWSKNEVESHLMRSIGLCSSLIISMFQLNKEEIYQLECSNELIITIINGVVTVNDKKCVFRNLDLKTIEKINEFKLHLMDILNNIRKFKDTDSFRY